ncbi:hypothetical protein D556_0863 [Bordetella holmesii 41130]|nr:hypothetical protein D556_0863 [Bordetella holmesii 41130]
MLTAGAAPRRRAQALRISGGRKGSAISRTPERPRYCRWHEGLV